MDEERSEIHELRGLVGQLAVQVGKLEAVVPTVISQNETIRTHGESLASLKTWRDEHEKSDEKRSKRLAGLAGIAGALGMKLLDWAHSHMSLFGFPPGR